VSGTIDYSKHTEGELVEMFGRLDPRYAPEECARLGDYLTVRGYRVTQGALEPGIAQPTAAKLQALIGSPLLFETTFEIGKVSGLNHLDPGVDATGPFKLGQLRVDGIYLYLSGRMGLRNDFGIRGYREVQWPVRSIANVESAGRLVRLEYRTEEGIPGSVQLQLADDSAAAALVAVLPKTRTPDFRPQIEANIKFAKELRARSPRTPVTWGLILVNILVFIGMLFDGAGLLQPSGLVALHWGSSFGPYTTDGQWWRLLTSLFVHFGLAHISNNMVALALFGPVVERFFRSWRYLLIYLLAGICSGLCSLAWHPMVNSAGASGAIFGIIGALLATLVRADARIPSDFQRTFLQGVVWIIACTLFSSLKHSGIDHAAHIGGFAAGMILGWIATPSSKSAKAIGLPG
jgi:membrane associated rhomboid family serine protease